jgi:hypothetical protein
MDPMALVLILWLVGMALGLIFVHGAHRRR